MSASFEDLVEDVLFYFWRQFCSPTTQILLSLTNKKYLQAYKKLFGEKKRLRFDVTKFISNEIGEGGFYDLLCWFHDNKWSITPETVIRTAICSHQKLFLIRMQIFCKGAKVHCTNLKLNRFQCQFSVASFSQILGQAGLSNGEEYIISMFKARSIPIKDQNIAIGACSGGHLDLFKKYFRSSLKPKPFLENVVFCALENEKFEIINWLTKENFISFDMDAWLQSRVQPPS
jgi:hypothetical protein